MVDALPFADQARAGDRSVLRSSAASNGRIATVELFAQLSELLNRLRLEPAIGQFLDAVGEPMLQEAPVVERWLGFEEIAPLLLQLFDRRGFQGRDAGQHGIGQRGSPSDLRSSAGPL